MMMCSIDSITCTVPTIEQCPTGEMFCNGSCNSSLMACGNYGDQRERMCIRKSWLCDGELDCFDGSDEGTFCESTTEKKTTVAMTTQTTTTPQKTVRPHTTTVQMRRSDILIDTVTLIAETSTSTISSDMTSQQRTTTLLDNHGITESTSVTSTASVLETLLRDAPFALPFMAVVGISLPVIVCLVYCVIRHRKKKTPMIMSRDRLRQGNDMHMMSLYRYSRHPPGRPASSLLTRSSSMDHVYIDIDRDTLPGEHLPLDDAAIYSLPEDYSRTLQQPRFHPQGFIETKEAPLCWQSVGNHETLKEPMLPLRKFGQTNGPPTRWPSVVNHGTIKEPMLPKRNFIKEGCPVDADKSSIQENKHCTPYEPLQRSSATLPVRTSNKASHLRMRTLRESNLGNSFTTIAECCAESSLKFSASSMQRGVDEYAKSTEIDERDSSYVYAKIYPKGCPGSNNSKSIANKRNLPRQTSHDCTHTKNSCNCFQNSQTCNTNIDATMRMGKSEYPESDNNADDQCDPALATHTNAIDCSDAQSDQQYASDNTDYHTDNRTQRTGDMNSRMLTATTKATNGSFDKHAHYQNSTKVSKISVNLKDNETFTNDVDTISGAKCYEDPSYFRDKHENDGQHHYLSVNSISRDRNAPPSKAFKASVDDTNAGQEPFELAYESDRDNFYDYASTSEPDMSYLHPVFDLRNGKSNESFEYIHPL